jgi:hypothetical protein
MALLGPQVAPPLITTNIKIDIQNVDFKKEMFL